MTEKRSWLPPGEENLFQEIKKKCVAAEKNGVKLWKMSIGQPTGPALRSARNAASKAVLSNAETMHEYQDNGSPGIAGFAQTFGKAHNAVALPKKADIDFLPINGTKQTLKLIPMACGGIYGKRITVGTMTDPGYPTPKTWCEILNQIHYSLPTNSENKFRFTVKEIVRMNVAFNLLMVNYPHNPSGQIATYGFWYALCAHCEKHGIRLFNDAAYILLSHHPDSCTLASIAIHFPNLSWCESYSASKLIGNGTGWVIGGIVGSSDFVADIRRIKGEADSGFCAPQAIGVLNALKRSKNAIRKIKEGYCQKIGHVIDILTNRGMNLAVYPWAGFFTLFNTPKMAFGEEVTDSKHFNELMIERTGIVGVPFHLYIRYAVVAPVMRKDFTTAIMEGFEKADVRY